MRSFLKLVLAVITAILVIDAAVLGVVYLKWGRGPSIEKHSLLLQPVSGPIIEYPAGGFTSGIFASDTPTLHSIRQNLAKAAVDDRIDGVVLRLGGPRTGLASLGEIRSAIQTVRDAGKTVWAWTDFVYTRDLYVASACDSFFVHPSGYVFLGGIYLERPYIKGTLEKLGIEPNLNRIESYKSAAELVLREDMSPEAREMVGWILDDFYPDLRDRTAEGFGIGPGELHQALERVLLLPEQLVEMGIGDGVRFWDEMKDALPKPKGKEEPRFVSASTYAEIDPADVGLKGKKKIAVVHAQGMITGAESGHDPLFGMTMGYRSVNGDLQAALDDEDVVAVVFRIDSGGGESLVSDRIGRMVEIVDEEKPVVVSMVDVAASGGYKIAYRARSLLANPNTITGSIGSITGKFNMRGFYNKLGITKDGLGRGPHPDFYSDYRSWTPEEYEMVREEHWAGYDQWIAGVAEHRGLTVAEVDSVARGRVWTGRQALERKLIDGLGDLDEAVRTARELAGLEADEKVTLVHYPKPEGILASILGTKITAVPDALLSRWIEDRARTVRTLTRGDLDLLEVPVP
jgi:protease-4